MLLPEPLSNPTELPFRGLYDLEVFIVSWKTNRFVVRLAEEE